LKNNCCTVVAYLIGKGLANYQKNSKFCSPLSYQTDSFFGYDSKIEKLFVVFNKKFWSPRSLQSFVKKVKKKTDNNFSALYFPVGKTNLLYGFTEVKSRELKLID
ncbi:MAG: hypothetical protein O4805_07320, partial [Trichodesmium sp. St16_bin2-tuft]|nr:hypothetical protein [Trichodesmium sp. St16_bin2-tuft]